jgi:hypothetical protein
MDEPKYSESKSVGLASGLSTSIDLPVWDRAINLRAFQIRLYPRRDSFW